MKELAITFYAILIAVGMAMAVKLIVDNKLVLITKAIKRLVRPTNYLCSKHAGKQPKGLALVCEKRCLFCRFNVK